MADIMNFPPTFQEFIHQYEFVDDKEIYTNGKLIQSFRVMQAWNHYADLIELRLADIYKTNYLMLHNVEAIEEIIK